MLSVCFCRPSECQGCFHPSCDLEGLAVPPDRRMFILECLLCLIGTGGGEEITGWLDTFIKWLITVRLVLCLASKCSTALKKKKKNQCGYFIISFISLGDQQRRKRVEGRDFWVWCNWCESRLKTSSGDNDTGLAITHCCLAKAHQTNHSWNCPSLGRWQYPARHIDSI